MCDCGNLQIRLQPLVGLLIFLLHGTSQLPRCYGSGSGLCAFCKWWHIVHAHSASGIFGLDWTFNLRLRWHSSSRGFCFYRFMDYRLYPHTTSFSVTVNFSPFMYSGLFFINFILFHIKGRGQKTEQCCGKNRPTLLDMFHYEIELNVNLQMQRMEKNKPTTT